MERLCAKIAANSLKQPIAIETDMSMVIHLLFKSKNGKNMKFAAIAIDYPMFSDKPNIDFTLKEIMEWEELTNVPKSY